jgi:hypothetical protein
MHETRRRVSLPAALMIVAVALVAAVFWATSAVAASGEPGQGEQGSRNGPAATTAQNEGETPDDCPDRGSESESSAEI